MIAHYTTNHVPLIHLILKKEEAVDFVDLVLAARSKDVPDSMVDAVYAVAACYAALTGENPAPDVDWGLEEEEGG